MEAEAEEHMQVDHQDGDGVPLDELDVRNASLDLESFASTYTGLGLLTRLLFVAEHAPQYTIEALRLAHAAVLKTSSVSLYHKIMELWKNYATGRQDSDQPPGMDTQWLAETKKNAQLLEERLDNDLKHFKANNIKESIRRCYDELGDFHMLSGDLGMALKCYSRARDYCGTSMSLAEMCLNIIKISIYQHQYVHALSYVLRANQALSGMPQGGGETKTAAAVVALLTKVECSAGLASLAQGAYRVAAGHFLAAALDEFAYTDVLSPNNVAMYGGLCAMATYSREELQTQVLSSASFKLFLELEPQVRDMLHKFQSSKYSQCLQTLDKMRPNLLLDCYLSRHVHFLYAMVRKKALVQFFSPYQCVSLDKMAQVFNTDVTSLEDELTVLILDGAISGKIDSQEKVLYASDVDQKASTFADVKLLGDTYHRSVQALVLRMAVKKHHVTVSASAAGKHHPFDVGAGTDGSVEGMMDQGLVQVVQGPGVVGFPGRRRMHFE
eukprot:scpid76260/ scgid31221/ COP9 signalosome complex subunit 1; G protein pathway suppressor 1; JAB1-containing signalosome subunit 1; Protein MFH